MSAAYELFQAFMILGYPLFAAIGLSSWGIYRAIRTTLSKPNKWIRTGFILLLSLCVFPGSIWLLAFFTEPCHGQGSLYYRISHPLLCSYEVVLAVPWWVPVLYTVDILMLIWSVRRTVKHEAGKLITFGVPLLYYFVFRIVALMLLEGVQKEIPFP
jgi:hypothetical protein